MSEVRALLLTDVVDSTKLSERIGDAAMAGVWAAHDRVARDLLPVWHGREIDKTDGMLLLFEHAQEAVGYAMAYHHALAVLDIPLKARAGLHVGPVILRENQPEDVARGAKPLEVDGLAKPTAARVMSLAHGGQTLLTPEARQALGQTGFKLESHGHWMIKGVSEPLELFEVGDPEQRFVPPPDGEKVYRVVRNADWWMPVRDIPNNLPFQGTSFIGRERELDEVKALLKKSRLITLLGMGGLGKTRLSLQVAAETIQDYPDGAWFLDLSPLRDPGLVVSEAAQVLDVREEPERPLIQTLCAHLKTRRALVVIDNCEHLVDACADLAHAILKAAPHVRMLASSRETLRVPGEHGYPILPLPVPRSGDDLAALSKSTAVQLFVARARQHKPAFELNEREAPAVAELVSRLEGIPLALELAAARVRSMSVADINKRLKDRYKILVGGDRVLQERQQTLRALVDWSYELLKENEQTVLSRLGVFVGGFDLAAAEEVCGADPIDSCDVLDLLQSLVEKSLVMLDESGDAPRYRMLETIRDYASEKLEQRAEKASMAERHCQHYFTLAKQIKNGLSGAEQGEWAKRAEAEIDNLRAAIALPLASGIDEFIAVKFCVALQGFWTLCGYASEGRNVVHAARALPAVQASDMAQAHALYVGAVLADVQSDHAESQQMLETCLALRRALGNPADIASTLSMLSQQRLFGGDVIGASAAEHEALQLFRQVGHRIGEMVCLVHLGLIAIYAGNDTQAREQLEQGLSIAREIKHQEGESWAELALGETAFEVGDQPRAYVRFQRSLAVCKSGGDKGGEASATCWLGRLDLQGNNLESARSRLSDALRAFRTFEMRRELLSCLEDHAVLAARSGALDKAVKLAAATTSLRSRLALKRSPRHEQRWEAQVASIKEAAARDTLPTLWLEGEMWDVENAMSSALAAH
jgi:predicted ATPase/class 3 adenylate cyclase